MDNPTLTMHWGTARAKVAILFDFIVTELMVVKSYCHETIGSLCLIVRCRMQAVYICSNES